MNYPIKHLSFSYQEEHIRFDFAKEYKGDAWGFAELDMPSTGEGIGHIDELQEDDWYDEQLFIFEQILLYFRACFKDEACLAASALLKETVIHVEPIWGLFVAFTANTAHIIMDRPNKSVFGSKVLFDKHEELNPNQSSKLILIAKNQYFDAITKLLTEEMNEYLSSVKNGDLMDFCCEFVLDDFMKVQFECEAIQAKYHESALALEFLKKSGYAVRDDFERQQEAVLAQTN